MKFYKENYQKIKHNLVEILLKRKHDELACKVVKGKGFFKFKLNKFMIREIRLDKNDAPIILIID